MRFVFGQHDRAGGQGRDLLADAGADAVVVRVALGDQARPAPDALFPDAPVAGPQTHGGPAQPLVDPYRGPRLRREQEPANPLADARAADPGPSRAGPVREPV